MLLTTQERNGKKRCSFLTSICGVMPFFSVSFKCVWEAFPRGLSKPMFENSFTFPKCRISKFSGIIFRIFKLLVSSISSITESLENFPRFVLVKPLYCWMIYYGSFSCFFVFFVHLNVDDWWNNAANQVFKGRFSRMPPASSASHVFNFRKPMRTTPIFLVILSHQTSCPVSFGHISIIPNTSSRHLTIWNGNGLLLSLLFFEVAASLLRAMRSADNKVSFISRRPDVIGAFQSSHCSTVPTSSRSLSGPLFSCCCVFWSWASMLQEFPFSCPCWCNNSRPSWFKWPCVISQPRLISA